MILKQMEGISLLWKDWVFEDSPRPREQLKDKNSWPWPLRLDL